MRFLISAVLLVLASTFPTVAHANPIYPIIGGAGGFSGSGTLTGSANGDGSYTVVGITGTGVTGLLRAGAFNGNDNQFFPNRANAFDTHGFSFTAAQGNTDFELNIASNGAGSYFLYLFDSDGYSATLPINLVITVGIPTLPFSPRGFANVRRQSSSPSTQDFSFSFDTIAATPEPSSILFLGTGLLSVAGAGIRRRFKGKS